MALAKLHNCCINANDNDISANTARGKLTSEINGAVPLVRVEGHHGFSESRLGDVVPEQLLHGGEHFDDIGDAGRLVVDGTITIGDQYTTAERSTALLHCSYWRHKTQSTTSLRCPTHKMHVLLRHVTAIIQLPDLPLQFAKFRSVE